MDLQPEIKEIICGFELGFKVRYNIFVTSNLEIIINFWDHYGTSNKDISEGYPSS